MTDLNRRALLVSLRIQAWSGRKHDKGISQNVISTAKAQSSKAGRFYKKLIRGSKSFDGFFRTSEQARRYLYQMTSPWLDEGYRILNTSPTGHDLFFEVNTTLAEFKETAMEFAKEFADNEYADAVEDAKKFLGSMFNQSDYPPKEIIMERFSFNVRYSTIPDKDWRNQAAAEIDDEDWDQIRGQFESDYAEATKLATQDLWQRVHNMVEHVHEQLTGDDKIIRDALFKNVAELAEILPRLNIADDPDLNSMAQEISDKLTIKNPQLVRDDPKLRAQMSNDAFGMFNKVKKFMV